MKDFVDREKEEREIENKYDTACKTNTGNLIRSKQWTREIKLEVEYRRDFVYCPIIQDIVFSPACVKPRVKRW